MAGLLGGLFDFVSGPGPETVQPSGGFQDVEGIGTDFAARLRDLLGPDVLESDTSKRLLETVRDRTGAVARTQRSRAGQFAQNRGFFDSGALADIFQGIDRQELESFTQEIGQLAFQLENRGLNLALPFLQSASQENFNLGQLNTGNILTERKANQDQEIAIANTILGGFGGGGGGGGGFVCWVARSIYGMDDPRWLLARHYVITMSPRTFYRFYVKYGERIAGWLDRHTWAKRFLRPAFDWMVKRATR